MPVIQVFAQPLDDVDAALRAVSREVADALGLRPSDVITTYIPVERCVVAGAPSATWPVVVIHGAARPATQLDSVRERVTAIVESWSDEDGSGSWVTWQLPG